MSVRLLTSSDFRRQPWQNGRGTTLELVRQADARGALLWRLSVADVVEPGPFSPLPGIDRIITLIDGNGFDLDFGDAQSPVSLRLFEPVSFSGDWSTMATTVHGPSRDFNVMTARGRIQARVDVLGDGAINAGFAYLYVAKGSADVIAGDSSVRVDAGQLLECHHESDLRIAVGEAGQLIVVHLATNDGSTLP